jgi:hypothetical protein
MWIESFLYTRIAHGLYRDPRAFDRTNLKQIAVDGEIRESCFVLKKYFLYLPFLYRSMLCYDAKIWYHVSEMTWVTNSMWARLLFCNYLNWSVFLSCSFELPEVMPSKFFCLSDLSSRSCTEAYYLGFFLTVQLFEELVLRLFCFSCNFRQTRDGSIDTGLGGLCVSRDEYDAMQVPIHSLYLGFASSLPPICYRISH